jgi:hypothetical protein
VVTLWTASNFLASVSPIHILTTSHSNDTTRTRLFSPIIHTPNRSLLPISTPRLSSSHSSRLSPAGSGDSSARGNYTRSNHLRTCCNNLTHITRVLNRSAYSKMTQALVQNLVALERGVPLGPTMRGKAMATRSWA